MSKFIDLTGRKYNKLTVIERVDSSDGITRWKCKCDCGNITEVRGCNLKNGSVKSCGCLKHKHAYNYSHGESQSPLYRMWISMIYRCHNPKNKAYQNYGARGITVCDDWHDYMNFKNWVNKTKTDSTYTLERIDVNKGYCPENCTWIPMNEQAKNRTTSIHITYNNETHILSEWCEILNLDYKLVHNRIYKLNWSFEKAISTPLNTSKSSKSRKENNG